MANAKAVNNLDALEQLINDVLVQTGKALRANGKPNRKTAALANVSRVFETNEKFNTVLDDLESEILRAKAVFQRDLDQLREKNKPPEPEPPVVQPAPPAPMMALDDDLPVALAMTARASSSQGPGALTPAAASHRAAQVAEAKPMAPFPNMGVDSTGSPSPRFAPKPKPESASPKPPAVPPRPGITSSPAAIKAASPALRTAASPAVKAESPAAKGASPALGAASPATAVKPSASPAAAALVKAAPPPAVPAPTSSAAPPAPMSLPIGTPDAGVADFFDLTSPVQTATATAATANSGGLNFTDMQFTLAPTADDAAGAGADPSHVEMFDFDSLTADPSAADLLGSTSSTAGAGASSLDLAAPTLDLTLPGTGSNLADAGSAPSIQPPPPPPPPPQQQQQQQEAEDKAAPDANMEDIFNLEGTSMDLEGGDSNFDDLFFGGGDTDMGDLGDDYNFQM